MKVTVIIAIMMVAQVSASFLEVFQGAVLSVQNSFGKLFSDVVTDVKDTVDCTILAVEHILSLSEDATARYQKKCGSAKNDTQNDSQLKNNFPVVEISIANNEEYLKKELPEEIDARINATLLKFLNGYNPHDKLEDVQKELAKETERLADVSDLVRKELDKLSKEIHLDFTNVERKGYKPSVDSILDELKVLEAIEENIRNASEANEIHRLVDDVLNKLHIIESSGANQNDNVDGILSDLERSSNRSYKDMRQQLEDWKAEEARHLNVIKAKMDEHEKLPKHLEYAKMDNTFAAIERPKIYIVPIEQEIASKTVTLNSKNAVQSKSPNIVTNTDSKFLTSTTKQISITPKIGNQPSLDATSPVQINDASGVITPVSISTSSYVNEINVDVMETLIPQRFKEEPTFDHMPGTTLDFTTPITIAEITLHSTNLATRQPTIKLLERSLKHRISRPVIIPGVTYFVPNTTELSTSPSVPTREPNTSIPKKTQERNTSVQKAIPKMSTSLYTPTSRARGSSDTNLGIYLNHLATTLMPTLDLLKTSLEPIRNLTTTELGNATSFPLMTSETNTIEEQIPEKPTSAPETVTEPNTSSAMMQPKATIYVSVMSPQPTISAMTSKSAASLLVTAINRTKSSTTIPEPTTSIPKITSESTTNAATPLKSVKSLKVTALKPTTRFAMTSEFTTDLSLTASESTTSFTVTSEPSSHLSLTPTELDTNATTPSELTRDLPVTATEPATNSAVNPEPTMDPLVNIPESSTNPGTIPELSTHLQVTVDGEIINSVMMPKSTTNILVMAAAATTSLTMTQDPNTSLPVTASRLISFVTTPEPTMNVSVTDTGVIINSITTPKPTMDLPATTSEPATSPTTNTESTIDLLVAVAELSTNPATTPELTTDLQEMATGSTINSIMSRKPTTSLLVTATDPTKSSTTISEPTTSIPMSAPALNILVTTPQPTTSPARTAIESTTERGTNPTTPQETTTDLSATVTEPATSSTLNPESTMDPSVTTPESSTNPGKLPEVKTNLQVTAIGEIINSVMMPKSTTNIPVMTTETSTSPTMTQDPNTSLPVTAFRLISIATKKEPTTNPPMKSTESPTNLTTTLKLAMHPPLKAPESNLGMISELKIIASESTTSPTKTSEPVLNMLIINSDATTRPITTPEPTTSLPVMISEQNSVTIPDPITNYPVTTLEPTISSAKLPGTTTEDTTYHLVKTTDIRTSAHVRITESTSSSPKIMLEANTSLTTVREPTNHLASNHSVLNTNLSGLAFKINASSTISPEPTTNLPVSTSQEPISSSHAMSPEPSMSSTVTILEPTLTSVITTLGPTTNPLMKVPESITKPSNILRETTTSRSIITSEPATSSTETISKSTTGSLVTRLKLVTNNLSNLQHPFNLPTHRPGVSTPSLNAFLNYIDRKEGFTRPIIQSTGMTATPVATPVVKILPLSYSKPLSITNGPINAKLDAFFIHLPPQNISSPYARRDYAVPMNRTVSGVLGLTPPKIGQDMPLPYIMKPSIALNINTRPRPLLIRHLTSQRPYDESPYGGNNNAPPLGKGMPQKRHILPQRRNDQNTPIRSSIILSTNLSSSLGLTTNKPAPTPKINNYDDADYKSFFHLPPKNSEAHRRALKEAKKLIEDSKRADRIINNIFNKKNKGISAFNFPKSLKIGK